MSRRTFGILVGMVVVGGAIGVVEVSRRYKTSVAQVPAAVERSEVTQPPAAAERRQPTGVANAPVAEVVPVTPQVERRRRVKEPKPIPIGVVPTEPTQVAVEPEPLIPLPIARAALDMVGADPEAELVWADAINDPAMSAHARSDLIEDLNESGFPDPKNVTADDLPLIVSRLALIEDLAPDAMDQTNADAFAEAYKDLVNMYAKVTAP